MSNSRDGRRPEGLTASEVRPKDGRRPEGLTAFDVRLLLVACLTACNGLTTVYEYRIVPCLDCDAGADAGTEPDATSPADADVVEDAGDGGEPDTSSPDSGSPDLGPVVSLALGRSHTCVALATGITRCWGKNTDGQLGVGDDGVHRTPTTVSGLGSVTALAADELHTCAVHVDGRLSCWGSDHESRLGVRPASSCATGACSLVPMLVTGAPPFGRKIVSFAGTSGNLAALDDGSLLAWGVPVFPSPVSPSTPAALATPSPVERVFAGTYHACYSSAGSLVCWGFNASGQLGRANLSSTEMAAVPGLTDVQDVALGITSTCVLRAGGVVQCFGSNTHGELGTTTTDTCNTVSCSVAPVTVTLPWPAVQIVAGEGHACARSGTGGLACWGSDLFGELGRGDSSGATKVAPTVVPLPDVAFVAAGGYHTCAVVKGGSLYCWGRNESGELGDGTVDHAAEPIPVSY